MSDPASYTVGWICALPTEYLAAQEFLDEEHKGPIVSPNDGNDYTLGKMWQHNVAIAVLPYGEYGIASAADVAANMRSTFHNIRIGLMVGIGGGAPSERHDIRLGDVVVSASRDGRSAVFQFDFGKSIQELGFQHTRFLDQPPLFLRAATAGMQTQYERKGHRLEETINDILDRNRRLRRKYGRPKPDTDILFKPDVVHGSKCGITARTCIADDPSDLVSRRERTEDDDNPTIHYGMIASSNSLMKDALARDKLAADKDVLCFEMEAAGLMNNFPCLVIRGICDYSDSHKNKEWQGYAAMAAAAYAKDLLRRIPINTIEAEKKIKGSQDINSQQSTKQNSDRLYNQRERRSDELGIGACAEEEPHYQKDFKTSELNHEQQKNVNPRRAEGSHQLPLRSSGYSQGLTLSNHSRLSLLKARASSNHHETTKMLDTPAAEDDFQPRLYIIQTVFGVSLNALYKSWGVPVPFILSDCFSTIEISGLDEEEIYALSGSTDDINRMKQVLSKKKRLGNVSDYEDIKSVAGLVIDFFIKLPDPLFTSAYYDDFLNAARIQNSNDLLCYNFIETLISALPHAHYAVARELFLHLDKVQKHSFKNHMTVEKLAVALASTLMGHERPHSDADLQRRVIRIVLENVSRIFRDLA